MRQLLRPLPPGHRLFEYRILQMLGQGGFGTTYLCRDENLQKAVVVKELTPHAIVTRQLNGDLAAQPGLVGRFHTVRSAFRDEARKLAKFTHPNIVRVNRYFEAHDTAYFVMDHEAGGSLRSLLRAKPDAFTEGEIEAIILPLCRGLAELHSLSLIHRDIKPDNIIIRPDGSPVLIDFGAALDLRIKADIEVIATPAYAPIEQFIPSAPRGPWVDIYAMGAVMYEMIATKPPMPSLNRARGLQLEKASSLGSGKYSDRLLGLIDKCLAMNFRERPQSTSEFLTLLEANQDYLLARVIDDAYASPRMIDHLMNWATPNSGLYIDEFVAFAICFPIIDLSWRLGKGTPDKTTFVRLSRMIGPRSVQSCLKQMTEKGFKSTRSELTLQLVHARLDEYAATYLLDRQQEEWRYEMTCKQVVRNCIAPSHSDDIPGFMELLGDVIDRARGRIKKAFRKAFQNVSWRKTDHGWVREIVHLGEEN